MNNKKELEKLLESLGDNRLEKENNERLNLLLHEPNLLKIYEDYIELHADLEHRSKKPIVLKKQKKWQTE